MQTPAPVSHQSRSDFSDDYLNMGPVPTLQAGLTTPSSSSAEPTENCGRFPGGSTDPWYIYAEYVSGQHGFISCPYRAQTGATHSYEVQIVKYSDGQYYGRGFLDGNALAIKRLHNSRTFRLGREGDTNAQASGEVSNPTREMTAYFSTLMIEPNVFFDSFSKPDLYQAVRDPGYVREGPIDNFCSSDAGTASAKGCTPAYGG
jgi:hypothetical protein